MKGYDAERETCALGEFLCIGKQVILDVNVKIKPKMTLLPHSYLFPSDVIQGFIFKSPIK